MFFKRFRDIKRDLDTSFTRKYKQSKNKKQQLEEEVRVLEEEPLLLLFLGVPNIP